MLGRFLLLFFILNYNYTLIAQNDVDWTCIQIIRYADTLVKRGKYSEAKVQYEKVCQLNEAKCPREKIQKIENRNAIPQKKVTDCVPPKIERATSKEKIKYRNAQLRKAMEFYDNCQLEEALECLKNVELLVPGSATREIQKINLEIQQRNK